MDEYIYFNSDIIYSNDFYNIFKLNSDIILKLFKKSFNKIFFPDILFNDDNLGNIIDIINNSDTYIKKIYIVFGDKYICENHDTFQSNMKLKYLHKLIENKNTINIIFNNMNKYDNIIQNTDLIYFINNTLINKITFNNLTSTNLDLFYYVIKNNRTYKILVYDYIKQYSRIIYPLGEDRSIKHFKYGLCYFDDSFIEAIKNNNILQSFIIYNNSDRFITDSLIKKLEENSVLNILQDINLTGLIDNNKQLIPFLRYNKHVNNLTITSLDNLDDIIDCLTDNPFNTKQEFIDIDFKEEITLLNYVIKLIKQSKSLKKISFNMCSFYEDNIEDFKNALINNHTLKTLKFIYCSFNKKEINQSSEEDYNKTVDDNIFLYDIIKDKRCTIQKLWIYTDGGWYPNNFYTKIFDSMVINQSITTLIINDENDNFTYKTIQSINKLLKLNSTLTALRCFTTYHCNYSGLLRSLIHNTTLTEIILDIEGYKLKKKDVYTLIELLTTNKTLTKIDCNLVGVFKDPEYTEYINYFIKALSSNTSLYYYNGPFIHNIDDEHYYLTIKNVFLEILKHNNTLIILPNWIVN